MPEKKGAQKNGRAMSQKDKVAELPKAKSTVRLCIIQVRLYNYKWIYQIVSQLCVLAHTCSSILERGTK